MKRRRSHPLVEQPSCAFAGFPLTPEAILIAVRWYLRNGLSYRDLEEFLAERGIEVDHVTLFRRVQRFTPLLIDAARPCQHSVGDCCFVDETYVRVFGSWRYVCRAVDQNGQVIDVYVSKKRDAKAATRFFVTAICSHGEPAEVTTEGTVALRVSDSDPASIVAMAECQYRGAHTFTMHLHTRFSVHLMLRVGWRGLMPQCPLTSWSGQPGDAATPDGRSSMGGIGGTVALSATLPRRRAIRAQTPGRPGWPNEPSSSSSSCPAARFRVRWLPAPSEGHPDRGALVPAVRAVVPGSRGAPR
jgi:transposase-like protein